MHGADLLADLSVVLAAAIVAVLVLHRLRLPAIAGFLVAGALIGPSGLGLIERGEDVEQQAEIGVVLLLFTIGLEFSLASLRRIARMVLVGGGLQVGLTTVATLGLAMAAGFSFERALFAGFLVALSSTAIVLRSLSERGEVDSPHGQLTVGILLFQDLCVVPMMLVVPMLAQGNASLASVGLAIGKAAAVMASTVALARFVLPPILRAVARTQRRDVFLLTVLAVCAAIAWATSLVGLSLSLGAFLAGLVLADSEYGHQALADVLPLRDLFTSLFFVSLGMLLDFEVLREEWRLVSLLAVGLILAKFVLAALAGLLMRAPVRVSLLAGAGVAQIGEFSFVLAQLGFDVGLESELELAEFLNASVITMLLAPLAGSLKPALSHLAARLRPLDRLLAARPIQERVSRSRSGHVVILGYGVGGELLAHSLKAAIQPYEILDLSVERVKLARSRGEPIEFGDVTRSDLLDHVHVRSAAQVAVLLNDPDATERAVRAVRALNPEVPITARARFRADVPRLREAGATHVVAQEVEGSLQVSSEVLVTAGRTVAEAEAIVDESRRSIGCG